MIEVYLILNIKCNNQQHTEHTHTKVVLQRERERKNRVKNVGLEITGICDKM